MTKTVAGVRLIIVAKQLQAKLRAIRSSPDEWMCALSMDVWDDSKRKKIEGLQWQLCQQ